MKRPNLIALCAALVLGALAVPSSASARDCTVESPCVVRLATVAPRGTPWAAQMERLKTYFEQQSGGRLDVRAYLGSSDGEVSLARQCKDGALEGIGVSIGAIGSLVPELGVFELPFLFDTAEQADNVIDNHLMSDVRQLLSSNGFQLYIFSENGFRNFATTNGTAVRTPSSLSGLTMRAQESWIHESMYQALNATPRAIPVTEVSTALSTGTVQGFDNTPLYSQAAGWPEFIDTWTVSNHIYQPAVVVWNRAWFESLPADLQAVMMSNQDAETRRGRNDIRSINPMLMQNFSAFGVTVVELTDAERAALAAATQRVHDEFRRRVPTGVGMLDTILRHR